MYARGMRVARAAWPELALGAATVTASGWCVENGLLARAIVIACLGGAAIAIGLRGSWTRGRLALAVRCPRLARAGLRTDGIEAPWAVLRAGESVLAAFESDGGRWAEFFAEARRDVFASVRRALDLHGAHRRALSALVGAPSGEARDRLEKQASEASRELHALALVLQELRAHVLASTAPRASVGGALDAVAVRADHLDESLASLAAASRVPAGASR